MTPYLNPQSQVNADQVQAQVWEGVCEWCLCEVLHHCSAFSTQSASPHWVSPCSPNLFLIYGQMDEFLL